MYRNSLVNSFSDCCLRSMPPRTNRSPVAAHPAAAPLSLAVNEPTSRRVAHSSTSTTDRPPTAPPPLPAPTLKPFPDGDRQEAQVLALPPGKGYLWPLASVHGSASAKAMVRVRQSGPP